MNYIVFIITKDENVFKDVTNGKYAGIEMTDEELKTVDKKELVTRILNAEGLFDLV